MWVLFGVLEDEARAKDPDSLPLSAAPTTMPNNQIGKAVFSPETVGGPQLLANEPMALEKQRDTEQKRLHGYGWVNQGAGVAHMPIEEAKKLILGRGCPFARARRFRRRWARDCRRAANRLGGRNITQTARRRRRAPDSQPRQGGHAQPPAGHRPGAPAHGEQPAAKPQGRGGH